MSEKPDDDWPSKWFLVALVFMVSFLVFFILADRNQPTIRDYIEQSEAPKWPF